MNNKKILAIIFILAIFFRLLSALIIPIFDKPDEGPHFTYLQFVAENKKLPVQVGPTGELHQPPFYQVFASFILSFIKTFTQDIWYQVFFLRFLSIIVSMFTLYLTYKIASMIFNNQKLIIGITAFAAFLPSHINLNSTITNANLGDLLSVLIIFFMLKILMEKENLKDIVLLGLVVGISLITRLSIIPAILTIPFAFVVKFYPNIKTNIKRIIKPLVIIAIIGLVISSWHFYRNFTLYEDFLGVSAVMIRPPDDIQKDTIFIVRLLGWTFITFWAAFGRTNGIFIGNLSSVTGISIFIISYLILLLVTLASLYGLYLFLKRYIKNKNILSGTQKKAFVIMLFHLIVLGLIFIRYNLWDFQPQGRLFFPAISTIAILFTLGIYNNFKTQYWKKISISYLIFLIMLNIISFVSLLHHYLQV